MPNYSFTHWGGKFCSAPPGIHSPLFFLVSFFIVLLLVKSAPVPVLVFLYVAFFEEESDLTFLLRTFCFLSNYGTSDDLNLKNTAFSWSVV